MTRAGRNIKFLVHIFILMCTFFAVTACQNANSQSADALNDRAYDYHYRNLDSTLSYANKAFEAASHYSAGQAEALNNKAFVYIAKMNYKKAYETLEEVKRLTDNQMELLVADVLLMRLCQRESHNKEFYSYMQSARQRLQRIDEERQTLTKRQQQRLAYAESELAIVASTYYYYLGLYDQAADALESLARNKYLEQDTAQLLNYYYVVGSGGIIKDKSQETVSQKEFDFLMRCLLLASQNGYNYWEANSLQAISEHLQNAEARQQLIRNNLPAMKFITPDNLPENWLPGYLASRALDLFYEYGDVYQTAGAYRTIAQCDWELHDYGQAIIHLHQALTGNPAIEQAPDLVASIREQLSLAYAAIGDKPQSDYNRNIYLDLQELTRQDQQLEARAEELKASAAKLNTMISAVVLAIIVIIILFIVFSYMRRQSDRQFSVDSLLNPLKAWTRQNDVIMSEKIEETEEVREQTALIRRQVEQNRKRNLEQRAKVALVNTITPLIDRIIHELRQIRQHKETPAVSAERYAYVMELTDQINEYNDVLTQWIQMRQGELSLHIESFPLKELFDILQRGRMSFQLKGIDFEVEETHVVVKADKTLTLFMLNTIADNARKFTPTGGSIRISAQEKEDCVELSVTDTGQGMTEEEQSNIFAPKPVIDRNETAERRGEQTSHGFGLLNCKGIIEKYKKVSRIFSVCNIGVESEKGNGSRFYFSLPKGILRLFVILSLSFNFTLTMSAQTTIEQLLDSARMVVDSVYFSNINGQYEATLEYAEKCIDLLNRQHHIAYPDEEGLMTLMRITEEEPAELRWWHEKQDCDFNVILDMRNEVAVAAMALHEWDLYHYNNRVYTQLFRERSADPTLGDYVSMMQLSETNKNIAVALLVIILLLLFPAYYFLYYRHRLHYRFLIESVNNINRTLLSNLSAEEKLQAVSRLWKGEKDENTELGIIVQRIRHSLEQAIDAEQTSNENIEIARDELRRTHFENDRLHVANSVLDNCLSSLKHETMYYPSRIRVLIDNDHPQIEAVDELSRYYKELYSIFAAQANRQTEIPLHVDNQMIEWLFELLTRQNKGEKPQIIGEETANGFVKVRVAMNHLPLTEEQCTELFTPLTTNVDFLLCRQIIRELGEETNARACGILAHQQEGKTIVELTITEKRWKNSKLSSSRTSHSN